MAAAAAAVAAQVASQMDKHNDVCIACTWTCTNIGFRRPRRCSFRQQQQQQYVSSKNKSFVFILPVHRARFACHSAAETLLQAFPHYVVTHLVSTPFGTFEDGHSASERAICGDSKTISASTAIHVFIDNKNDCMTHGRSDWTRSTLVLFGFWSFTLLHTNHIVFPSQFTIRSDNISTAVCQLYLALVLLYPPTDYGRLANVANHHNFSSQNFWI